MSDDVGGRVDFAGIQALSSRGAGYSVAAKCLQVQADAEALDPSLRSSDGVTLHADARSWYVGALGEIEVGLLLAALGPKWFVRHAVPIGAGTKDVDHLVIGPGGVFAINTKHHAGASIWVGDFVLRVNNVNTRHVKQAQSDAMDVGRRLTTKVGFPVPVISVLAILGARSINDKRTPAAGLVAVVDAKNLVSWLVARPQQLSDSELALIEFAAEEPETWHVDPRAADTLRVMPRFERLVLQVGTLSVAAQVPSQAKTAATRTTTRPTTGAPNRALNRTPARSRATPPRSPARRKRRERVTLGDLVKLWLACGLIITAMSVLQGIANQPCTSPAGCVLPSLLMAFAPLLNLGVVAALGAALVGTVLWAIRRLTQ
ncbi:MULTISPECIES: nuclease-related domain-containing protein [unclassified Cryobacterium]|uniref:nuclease-related domain-containing protein n=1 Tax=unclassified Cryobacterium TaxID=2649013 RepID=UPI002AB56B94|nr:MULTISPECIES: nuclease-related domain-containing protein [unclassified Cryobacterium]MDY7528876.1 nuclease-related domain-containing protein [Cryobacterium sp. 10C2]MEB0288078.1 nuclease-related domain-containing protein [Cryobacterium sp. 10S3]MEB0291926.1 nuclease-related domain-containing protein [Cryobacterium sp. 10C2]WPX12638.1 nuclease-related domain-containing protein [Cryobacterium sp. 10S3]